MYIMATNKNEAKLINLNNCSAIRYTDGKVFAYYGGNNKELIISCDEAKGKDVISKIYTAISEGKSSLEIA